MNPYSAYTQARELVDENDKRKVLVAVLGALPEKIEGVKLLIGQKKYEKKFQELTKITMVLEILDQSLDMSFGELPKNLSSLYRYLIKRLTEVHSTLDLNTLEECKGIIGNIADGFARAYEQVKKGARPASDETGPRIKTQI